MQDDSISPLTAFLDASINFKNEEVFILYAVMLFISTAICLVLFYKKINGKTILQTYPHSFPSQECTQIRVAREQRTSL